MPRTMIAAILMIATAAVAGAQEDFASADAELNKLYKEIQTRLAGDQAKLHLLTATQRAWVAFRDAECAFSASGVDGGSAYPEIVANCMADLTQTRIGDFHAYLACEEGDLSCPVPAE